MTQERSGSGIVVAICIGMFVLLTVISFLTGGW